MTKDSNDIRRSINFPADVYAKLKEIACSEEISINAVTIRELRKVLNIPVRKKDK